MQIEQAKRMEELKAGQLWKLELGYVSIVELGPRHVFYRMLRQPDQHVALTWMIKLEAFLRYLQQSEAVLIGAQTEPVPASTSSLGEEGNLGLGILGPVGWPRNAAALCGVS